MGIDESVLKINVPENLWHDIGLAPKDGRIIYVKDLEGNVDLAKYDDYGWTAELGCCSNFIKWARLSI